MIPILMTASISTRGMKNASFTDEEREKMYFETLQFYLDNIVLKDNLNKIKIVFVENSGWDLQEFKLKFKLKSLNNVEFISLDTKLFDITKGKGYNELLLINEALHKSEFIKKSGSFFKVTGRYPVFNLYYFLNQADNLINKKDKVLYIDLKDHKLYDYLKLGWEGHSADVRIFAAKNEFYLKFIANRYKELNDFSGSLLEGLMFNIAKSIQGKGNEYLRFKREPLFGGLEGSNVDAISFTKNQNSTKAKIKRFIGNFIRLFMPWFWF